MSRLSPNAAELATLRAITFRLSSTPTPQLPQQVAAITTALANCKTLFSSVYASASQSSSEASVAIHKYRTFLSTLLQDRTIQGRWTAIVLIKTTIEIGGWETLQRSLPWVRGLLGTLSKPDPPSSKKLCLITLTRIFVLTREYPTLVREITTPSLSAYIQTCLHLLSSNPPFDLLEAILESFNQLLPRHPTVFRSYVKQLQQILGPILAPTPSTKLSKEQTKGHGLEPSFQVAEAARRLYVQLPCCAPKGASSEDWTKGVRDIVENTHRVADKVFRAVVEDWHPSAAATPAVNGHTLDDEVQDMDENSLNLLPWSGIYAGGERLSGLLRVVKGYLENPTPNAVTLPIGLLMDLVTRMLSLTVPVVAGTTPLQNNVRSNNQVSKEERENLWTLLPQVHTETIELLVALVSRLEDNAPGLDSVILDLLVLVFGSEMNSVQIRVGCYSAVADLLGRSGPALKKPSIDSLSTIIRKCCDDIFPVIPATSLVNKSPSHGKANGTKQQQATNNADAFLDSSLNSKASSSDYIGLRKAAYHLLTTLLSGVPAQYLSDSLRTRIDRTAILSRHKDTLIASVLNPPPSKKFGKPAASILPLLTRAFASARDVESLARPRMPVLRTGNREIDVDMDIEEEEQEEETRDGLAEGEHFIGEELNTLLEFASQPDERVMDDDVPMQVETTAEGFASHTAEVLLPASPSTEVQAATSSALDSDQSSNKRFHAQDVALSPAKRVKVHVDEGPLQAEAALESLGHIPPPASIQLEGKTQVSTVATQTIVEVGGRNGRDDGVNGNANSNTVGKDEDDEDDDFGELVLGQDTDEETDS